MIQSKSTNGTLSGSDAKLGRDRVRRVSAGDGILRALCRHLARHRRLHPRLGLRLLPEAAPKGGGGGCAQADTGAASKKTRLIYLFLTAF